MSQYLLSFAKDNLAGKSDAYLALLWCMYKANQSKGRYSDHIKLHLTAAADQLLGTDYQRIAARFKRILDARPELDWVAPSGLSPLAHLQIKNFRGFGELGSDDRGTLLRFSKIKNIFYAPNGGGKSSLCEALEFATTGHIKEADRRKTKIRQYIARGAGKTSLTLMGTDKKPVTRSLTWSSCFIDRNRLQEFSLLGSKDTGSAESDVVATLFGLEEFQEVISRFVKPESFSLKSFQRPDVAEAMASLERDRAGLLEQRNSHAMNVAALNSEVCGYLGLQIGQQYAVRARYARLAKLAELKIRKAERLKLAKSPIVVPMKRIHRAVGIARRLLLQKSKIEAAFLRNVTAVNYRAVYEALQAIENTEASDICPACSTPLHSVAENPFEKARRELQTLGALEQLQITQRRIAERIAQMAVGIAASFAGVDTNTRLGVPCVLPLDDLHSVIADFHTATDRAGISAQVLQLLTQLLTENLAGVDIYIDACEKKHVEVAQADAQVKRLEEQALTLKQAAETLKGSFTDKKTSQQALTDTGKRLADLTLQRAALKGHEADNVRFNSLIHQLQVEYGNLYRDLLDYKLSLEKTRIAGIEAKAAEYYKAINHHDEEHERIDSLSFDKTSESYRIKISNADGTSLDAFSVLSEGHLRALGLSLLLAAAEKNKFPLIVFDDVVNAIDSDHRSNIIDLFFSDPYLRCTQMVVTTHDRLFWERFCIIAERHPQSDQHGSFVLSYTNRGIIIDHAGGFQEKVYRAMGVYDIRQALIYCRIWFESMVLEYCLDNAVSITAQFGKSQLKKNNYLQISLESTFRLVEPRIAYDLEHFNLIKNDLVNWGGQNQEHHAFDEGGLNFVHSKTSMEVIKIYDAIRLLECQLFPAKKQASCKNLLGDLNEKIGACVGKIEKLDKAPVEVQQAHKQRLAALQKRAEELAQELAYVEVCLAANAQ
jgi:DNA sulfur modification protein DndD